MISSELMRELPRRYQEDPIMNNIMSANGSELDRLFAHIADLAKQRFAVTATWGLHEWENFVGITHGEGLTIEQRRSRVLAKLMMINTMTHFRMNTIIQNFIRSSYVVELISKYAIKVVITELELAVKALYEVIEEIKPAHLGLVVEFRTDQSLFFSFYSKANDRYILHPKFLCGKVIAGINVGFYTKNAVGIHISPCKLAGKMYLNVLISGYSMQYESYKITAF